MILTSAWVLTFFTPSNHPTQTKLRSSSSKSGIPHIFWNPLSPIFIYYDIDVNHTYTTERKNMIFQNTCLQVNHVCPWCIMGSSRGWANHFFHVKSRYFLPEGKGKFFQTVSLIWIILHSGTLVGLSLKFMMLCYVSNKRKEGWKEVASMQFETLIFNTFSCFNRNHRLFKYYRDVVILTYTRANYKIS